MKCARINYVLISLRIHPTHQIGTIKAQMLLNAACVFSCTVRVWQTDCAATVSKHCFQWQMSQLCLTLRYYMNHTCWHSSLLRANRLNWARECGIWQNRHKYRTGDCRPAGRQNQSIGTMAHCATRRHRANTSYMRHRCVVCDHRHILLFNWCRYDHSTLTAYTSCFHPCILHVHVCIRI